MISKAGVPWAGTPAFAFVALREILYYGWFINGIEPHEVSKLRT